MRISRTLTAAGTTAVLALTLTGCNVGGDKVNEPFKDAPRAATNSGAADIVTMPDGFSNVAAKCDGPNRVYVAFHKNSPYAAITVVANDPRCTGR